jgi:hypothetical protein
MRFRLAAEISLQSNTVMDMEFNARQNSIVPVGSAFPRGGRISFPPHA